MSTDTLWAVTLGGDTIASRVGNTVSVSWGGYLLVAFTIAAIVSLLRPSRTK